MKLKLGFALIFMWSQAQALESRWQDRSLWSSQVGNVLDFFNTHAWDESSGSYASELNQYGERTSENRDVVALSRMIYANAKASDGRQDLRRARKSADFLIAHMTARDAHGLYFKSVVDGYGVEVSSGRPYVFIFEESYPIAGLIALYQASPQTQSDLLPIIQDAAQSFWRRFHDPVNGGLFYYYNFARADHSNDQGLTHKSYQSTIYPISSFLLALRQADAQNSALYDRWIRELLDVALTHLVERKNNEPTGWLRERMNEQFEVDTTYRMSEVGHIAQLAWVLGVALDQHIVSDASQISDYRKTARLLLTKLIEHHGFSPIGVVYDAFDRTTGRPWVEGTSPATTAWWTNLEAIIAYAYAFKSDLLGPERKAELSTLLDGLTESYFKYFVDAEHGGEFFRIDATNGQVVDATKGSAGKSGYHVSETYLYLFGENGFALEF